MPSRVWQFSLGGSTFLALQTQWLKLNRSPAKTHALGLVGLTLILYAGVFFSEFESYPGWRAIVPTIGTCFLLFAFAHNPPTSYLTKKPLLKLGDMSYSIYLWHWPVLIIATKLGLIDNPLYKLLLITGILTISYLSHTFIEKPFWKGKFSKGPLRMMVLTLSLIHI